MSKPAPTNNKGTGKKSSRTGLPKNTAIFIICMGIAVFLWLGVQLSQKYTGDIPVHISYSNLPTKQVSVYPLQEQGTARVNATGFRLLWANMRWGRLELNIDLNDYQNAEYVLADAIVSNALTDLPAGYTLIGFRPDTLHLSFAPKATKKVPVVLDQQITMARQYDLKDQIQLQPDSVTVVGPRSIVDTLKSWKTSLLTLDELKETVTDTISLAKPTNPAIKLNPGKIIYTVPVEMLTEASVQVPIDLKNAPLGVDVAIFPKEAQVTFMVGLSNQENAKSAFFKVSADFQDVNLEKDQYVPLIITQSPDFIKSPTVSPVTVEYIIYQE